MLIDPPDSPDPQELSEPGQQWWQRYSRWGVTLRRNSGCCSALFMIIVAPLVIIVGLGYLWFLSVGARFDYIQILQTLLFGLPYVVVNGVVNSSRFRPVLQRRPILSQVPNIVLLGSIYVYLSVTHIFTYIYLINLVVYGIILFCTSTHWWKNSIGRFPNVELALCLIVLGICVVSSLWFSSKDYWGALWISIGTIALLVCVFFQLRKWRISSTRDS